jgi:hypothetical protein
MSASAILYMSASVPECFRKLTATSTILQLCFVYPFAGFILSMLGAYILGPRLMPLYEKAMPVRAQYPVYCALHHAESRSNFIPNLVARCLAESRSLSHG